MAANLFREEALDFQKNSVWGKVLVIQPISHKLLIFLVGLVVSLVLVLLITGQYPRRVTVAGFVSPDRGVVKVFSQQPGLIENISVVRGQSVTKGQFLLQINSARNVIGGTDLQSQAIEKLEGQKRLLEAQTFRILELTKLKMEGFNSRLEMNEKELIHLHTQKRIQKRRIDLLLEEYNNLKSLAGKNLVAKNRLNQSEARVLELDLQLETQEQQIVSRISEARNLKKLIEQLQMEQEVSLGNLKSEISTVEQKLQESIASKTLVVIAPADGTISSIQAIEGGQVNSARPLIAILPADSIFEVRLYVPTRAAGFLEIGQVVHVRYDAFPYQRYGIAEGRINSIDRVILLPSEINAPLALSEPVYELIIELKAQHITGYGEQWPLQAGMTLSADILLEHRTLIDWLLDPLYSLQGRL